MEPEKGLEKLLEEAALASDQDEIKEKKSATRLMTVHTSKGLEFDYVFIAGLEDSLFPHKMNDSKNENDEDSEEERRLFYVALTRARKKVYLSYASLRTIYGSKEVKMPSEFILDIDNVYLEEEGGTSREKIIRFD
jgi:DNA helicase II / ATP-dependent DNA helicase PcrA